MFARDGATHCLPCVGPLRRHAGQMRLGEGPPWETGPVALTRFWLLPRIGDTKVT